MSRLEALFELGERTRTPLGIGCASLKAMEAPVRFPALGQPLGISLDAVLSGAPGYSWAREGGTVDISCRPARSMRGSALNLVLRQFSIPSCTMAEANHYLLLALHSRLHPGTGVAGEYNPGRSSATVGPMRLKDVPVWQVLNRIVASGPKGVWYVLAPPEHLGAVRLQDAWGVVAYDDPGFGEIPALIRRRLTMYPQGVHTK